MIHDDDDDDDRDIMIMNSLYDDATYHEHITIITMCYTIIMLNVWRGAVITLWIFSKILFHFYWLIIFCFVIFLQSK